MLNSRMIRVAIVAALLGGAAFGAVAEDKKAAMGDDPVVAKVNSAVIKKSDVEAAIKQLGGQAAQLPEEMLFPAVRDQLVSAELVTDAAAAAKIQNTKEYKEEINQLGAKLAQQIYMKKTVDAMITPEMLQSAYQDYIKANPPGEEVRASHILVKTEDEAKQIIADLKKGGDFAEIAKTKSQDPSAAKQGGDLGYFTQKDMVKPFADAAFAMKVGEISETPVKTDFGWHVIKVVDRRQAQPPKFEDIKDQLKQHLAQQEVAKVLEDLRSKAKIEEFNADGTPVKAPPLAGMGDAAPMTK